MLGVLLDSFLQTVKIELALEGYLMLEYCATYTSSVLVVYSR